MKVKTDRLVDLDFQFDLFVEDLAPYSCEKAYKTRFSAIEQPHFPLPGNPFIEVVFDEGPKVRDPGAHPDEQQIGAVVVRNEELTSLRSGSSDLPTGGASQR